MLTFFSVKHYHVKLCGYLALEVSINFSGAGAPDSCCGEVTAVAVSSCGELVAAAASSWAKLVAAADSSWGERVAGSGAEDADA